MERDDDGDQATGDDSVTRTEWQSTVPPSTAVVEAIADATDRDPVEIDPLFGTLDLDALDDLLAEGGARSSEVSVSFVHGGARVSVSSDGTVEASPLD